MLLPFKDHRPVVADSAYVDPTAVVIGDVTIAEGASVWPNVTIRADIDSVTIGEDTNIQDNSCIHEDFDFPVKIGSRCVVGHSVTLHGCDIEDECLIGMGSTIMNGCKIGTGSIIAAGALLVEGTEVPPRSVVMGSPGKVRRDATDEAVDRIRAGAAGYAERAQIHKKGL